MEHANITEVYSVIRKYCRVSFCGTSHEQVYNSTQLAVALCVIVSVLYCTQCMMCR